MNPHDDPAKRWQQIDAIFSTAVERPTADRARFLDGACDGDPTLREEIESLLTADRQAQNFLAQPIGRAPAEAMPTETTPAGTCEGRRIGSYELLQEIGQGGMGTVFLARRADDQHERQVAIKLMRHRSENRELRNRFHTEQQALARLEHAYIARLYDSGVTPEGQPFLVMEHVQGVPIDRYCRQLGLDIAERLKLFRQVCEAVALAHRHLLVHRDIKPTNILVTSDGTPKLLDFGIAKLLDAGRLGLDKTQTGLRLMSPRWASPEQILGQAVTTATDIYSLGVLLYVLLSGEHPHPISDGEPEAWRVVCEHEPKRPSSIVLKSDPESPKPGPRPRELRRRLRGDLDNIVLKALEKEPHRRYGSVEQLSDDLRRHLERRPVRARPATLRYRTGKFLRRRRLAVAAVAMVVILSIGFAFALLRQAERIGIERDRAEQALEFVMSLFESPSPDEGLSKDVTARQILALGGQRISSELTEQPEIQATLMDAIGGTYITLGLFDEASPLVHNSLEIRQHILGEKHTDVATSLNRLAELYHYQGRYEDAEPLYRRALTLRRSLRGVEPEDLARTLNSLGALVRDRGGVEEAKSLHREALEIQRQAPQPAEELISQTLNYLALVAERLGEYQQAIELYRETLDIRRRLMGIDHPGVAHTLNNLGGLLNELGNYREAEEHLREALAISDTKLDVDHPQVTDTRARLARSLWRQGQTKTAEPMLRDALSQYRATFGENHFEVAETLQDLAMLLASEGQLDEAEQLLRQALDSSRAYGEEHPRFIECLSHLAEVQGLQGDHEAAEAAFRRALDVLRETMPLGHLGLVHPLLGLGNVLADRDELAAAEGFLRQALHILTHTLPPEALPIAFAEGALGACLSASSRYPEAETLLVQSHAVIKAQLPASHPDLTTARKRLADLYRAWGRPEKLAAL